MGGFLGIDLLGNFDLVFQFQYVVDIIVYGMMYGEFIWWSLSRYINFVEIDFYNV